MRVLADTHLLVWAVAQSFRLSAEARAQLLDPDASVIFSVVSIWEIGIKAAKGLPDFKFDIRVIRRNLLDRDWNELGVTGEHAVTAAGLPPIHGDPFDRMLVAQATVEGALLLTSDKKVARYPGPVRLV